MIRSLKLALATLALGALTATTAVAQNKDSTAVQAGMGDKPTFATVVAAVNATPATIEILKARTDFAPSDIMLVNVRDLAQGEDESALKSALEQHASHTEQLRATLGTNAAVSGALSTQTPTLTAADVIAVQAQPTGKVIVFYRKGE